jgi:hypothetical protein
VTGHRGQRLALLLVLAALAATLAACGGSDGGPRNVAALTADKPVADVHCKTCRAG